MKAADLGYAEVTDARKRVPGLKLRLSFGLGYNFKQFQYE